MTALTRRVGEPGQSLDDREARHPFGEGLQMLIGQQRGGHQHGDLLAVLHGLERRPHRDLGLAMPTSPQITRSIGTGFSISDLTSAIAVIWSTVSVKPNASSISTCQGVRTERVARAA
jgi:hypothetical protein